MSPQVTCLQSSSHQKHLKARPVLLTVSLALFREFLYFLILGQRRKDVWIWQLGRASHSWVSLTKA